MLFAFQSSGGIEIETGLDDSKSNVEISGQRIQRLTLGMSYKVTETLGVEKLHGARQIYTLDAFSSRVSSDFGEDEGTSHSMWSEICIDDGVTLLAFFQEVKD